MNFKFETRQRDSDLKVFTNQSKDGGALRDVTEGTLPESTGIFSSPRLLSGPDNESSGSWTVLQ